MITYRCPVCEIRCKLSTCPVCGSRTDVESVVYWCPTCNVPTWTETCPCCGTKGIHVTTDLRPVFPQERLLMELLLGIPLKYRDSSVWFGGGHYIVDGKTVRLPSSIWGKANIAQVQADLVAYDDSNQQNSFDTYAQRWIAANAQRYHDITAEAMLAIQEAAKPFKISEMFVSFSGGKDSTVTSNLVIRTLGTPSIIHLYGNTTLEFPESEHYVARFRQNNRRTPMLVAQNTEKNFYDMCDIVGPPSRVKRWCCTVFKTGAITRKIEKTFPGIKKLLSCYYIFAP